jgi:hypothetical protein
VPGGAALDVLRLGLTGVSAVLTVPSAERCTLLLNAARRCYAKGLGGADGESRTRTTLAGLRILSPVCLPVPPRPHPAKAWQGNV